MKTRIGFEIHAQLKTNTKLFCSCGTNYRETAPNTLICPVCTSQPGSKPFGINEKALEGALKIALMLGCRPVVEKQVVMQRKHYFYPDLPSNYQRTSRPLAADGAIGGVRITEVHIEEDPGRYDLRAGSVDYNRCGIPLVEIVTAPDMTSIEQARDFLNKLHINLLYLDVVRDEPGSSRIDVNVSLEVGKGEGTRVEIKNINSFHSVYKALSYEFIRQKNLIQRGMEIKRETRHFDEAQETTIGLREKESVADYRYIPDPDVVPILISTELVKKISGLLPESPENRLERIVREYCIEKKVARVLTSEKEFADFFEQVAKEVGDRKLAASFLTRELRRVLNWNGLKLRESGIRPEHISELLGMLERKEITALTAHKLIEQLVIRPASVRELADMVGSIDVIRGEGEISKIIEEVVSENAKAVGEYRKGEAKVVHFLMGSIMEKGGWRLDPDITRKILIKKISGNVNG